MHIKRSPIRLVGFWLGSGSLVLGFDVLGDTDMEQSSRIAEAIGRVSQTVCETV